MTNATKLAGGLRLLAGQLEGEELTKTQKAQAEKARERLFIEMLEAKAGQLPRRLYSKWARLPGARIRKHADVHQLPIGEKTFDLPGLIDRLHAICVQIGTMSSGNPHLKQADSEQRSLDERIKIAKLNHEEKRAELLDLQLEQQRGNTISRDEWKLRVSWMSSRLANVGNQLGKKIGPESQRLFNELLVDIEKDLTEESQNQKEAENGHATNA